MSYLHLSRTRTRERSSSPPLRSTIRRDTKHTHFINLSDHEEDCQDDYPYSSSHRPVKTSRALTVRNQPSQLERYNIWNDRHKSEDRDEYQPYKYSSLCQRPCDDDDHCMRHDPEERAFRVKLAATLSRPRPSSSHHHHHHETHFWPGEMFRRKEKWVDEGWETCERSRSRSLSREVGQRDSFWGDDGFWLDQRKESEEEMWRRGFEVRRTKTEDWRPLNGWRRG